METIPDRLSVYITTETCKLIFISDGNDNTAISKVIRYMGQSIQERIK